MTHILSKHNIFFLSFILIIITSCGPSKYLNEGEAILKHSEIVIEDEDYPVDNKSKLKLNLTNFVKQKPKNNYLLIFPNENFYFRKKSENGIWRSKLLRTKANNPPTMFDANLIEASALSMENYLRNKKGYYHADVDYTIESYYHNRAVKYYIDLKQRYKINSIEYFSRDTAILQHIEDLQDNSFLKVGDPIDAAAFDQELNRISLALQNKGYANFATNYFRIKGDSSNVDNAVDVFMELLPPLPDSSHQRFRIGEVNVFTDYRRNQDLSDQVPFIYNGKKYYKELDNFLVRPRTIDDNLFLRPGNLFRRDDRTKTQKKLSSLGTYRFVALNAKIDEEKDSLIHYDVILTPFVNKWVADFGWDFFFSNINQSNTNRNLFGFSISNVLKNRNFLGGAEQFSLSTDVGLDLQLQPEIEARTFNVGVNGALEIPRQKDLFKLAKTLKSFGILSDKGLRDFKENTRTNIGLGYNYVSIKDNYVRSSINANYSFDYKPNATTRFVIRQVGLELNDYTLQDSFAIRNGNNPLLIRSFDDNLLTGILFRDITYVYSQPVTDVGNSFTFISTFEISGWETYFLNQLYNGISGNSDAWRINNNIEFSKYFKLEADPRFYHFFSKKHHLAARLFAGIIIPFADSEVSPYNKQFSVGGPNSLRGWDQKELGPGGYSDLLITPVDNQLFFQTGDIKIEANVEYRFDLFWYLEGAFFIDAGNVWTLKENEERAGAQITNNFYEDIAVSAGYGLRFDFTYFIIRFDFGYKIRSPYSLERQRNWYKFKEIGDQGFGNFQVAINYPF